DRELGAEVARICWSTMADPRDLRPENVKSMVRKVPGHHKCDGLAPVVIVPGGIGQVIAMQDECQRQYQVEQSIPPTRFRQARHLDKHTSSNRAETLRMRWGSLRFLNRSEFAL